VPILHPANLLLSVLWLDSLMEVSPVQKLDPKTPLRSALAFDSLTRDLMIDERLEVMLGLMM